MRTFRTLFWVQGEITIERQSVDLKRLGRMVRLYRRKAKLRQEDLAELIEVSVNTVSRIENGSSKCSLETLLTIAEALHVSPNHLLKGNYREVESDFYDYIDSIAREVQERTVKRNQEVFENIKQGFQKDRERYRYERERNIAEQQKGK